MGFGSGSAFGVRRLAFGAFDGRRGWVGLGRVFGAEIAGLIELSNQTTKSISRTRRLTISYSDFLRVTCLRSQEVGEDSEWVGGGMVTMFPTCRFVSFTVRVSADCCILTI